MTLLTLILALLLEQVRPLPVRRWVLVPLGRGMATLGGRCGDAPPRATRTIWLAVMAAGTLGSALGYWLLWELHPALAFGFNVVVLYSAMGFRQESRFFTEIHVALRLGEIDRARTLLGQWRGSQYPDASASEIARLAIEKALVAAHRTVFGVGFWFVLLPGPSGALMYRLARFLAEEPDAWGRIAGDGAGKGFAQRGFDFIDAVPARLTAAVFSVMGNFEDAIYCWRSQAVLWPERSSAILIASGGGALGVRLGMPVHESGAILDRPEMGLGDDANVDHMQSTVGLVWRALLVCLFLLALLGAAGWVGR